MRRFSRWSRNLSLIEKFIFLPQIINGDFEIGFSLSQKFIFLSEIINGDFVIGFLFFYFFNKLFISKF